METSNIYESISPQLENSSNKNFYIFILVVVLLFILILWFNRDLYYTKKQEHMSGGTMAQMFAQDSQDVYLKGNVDQLATGNFDLLWNQPTMIANSYLNRGSPLPSLALALPNTSMNPNSNNNLTSNQIISNNSNDSNELNTLNSIASAKSANSVKPMIAFKSNDYTDHVKGIDYVGSNCFKDPASCGSWFGGSRLGSGWVDSLSDADTKPFVNLQGNVVYPDSYVSSYWIQPNFDINKPFPVIPDPIL